MLGALLCPLEDRFTSKTGEHFLFTSVISHSTPENSNRTHNRNQTPILHMNHTSYKNTSWLKYILNNNISNKHFYTDSLNICDVFFVDYYRPKFLILLLEFIGIHNDLLILKILVVKYLSS
jgi:hypothetical protein